MTSIYRLSWQLTIDLIEFVIKFRRISLFNVSQMVTLIARERPKVEENNCKVL